MYKEINSYLWEFYEKLKNGQCTRKEYEDALTVLGGMERTGLITQKEFKKWNSYFNGIYAAEIKTLNLSTRAKNCLYREHIYTCGELRKRLLSGTEKKDFFQIRNIGDVTAAEILTEAIRCRFITVEELLSSSWRPQHREKVRTWLANVGEPNEKTGAEMHP